MARADVGWSGDVPTFPRIQGADACGRIVSVGDGVDESRVGERILVSPVFHDPGDPLARAVYFGSEVDGAFAEYTVVPSRFAVVVDCDWSDVELASIPCSYSAAENMLSRAAVGAAKRWSSRERREVLVLRLCNSWRDVALAWLRSPRRRSTTRFASWEPTCCCRATAT